MAELRAPRPDAVDGISIEAVDLDKRTQRQLDTVPGVLRELCLAIW